MESDLVIDLESYCRLDSSGQLNKVLLKSNLISKARKYSAQKNQSSLKSYLNHIIDILRDLSFESPKDKKDFLENLGLSTIKEFFNIDQLFNVRMEDFRLNLLYLINLVHHDQGSNLNIDRRIDILSYTVGAINLYKEEIKGYKKRFDKRSFTHSSSARSLDASPVRSLSKNSLAPSASINLSKNEMGNRSLPGSLSRLIRQGSAPSQGTPLETIHSSASDEAEPKKTPTPPDDVARSIAVSTNIKVFKRGESDLNPAMLRRRLQNYIDPVAESRRPDSHGDSGELSRSSSFGKVSSPDSYGAGVYSRAGSITNEVVDIEIRSRPLSQSKWGDLLAATGKMTPAGRRFRNERSSSGLTGSRSASTINKNSEDLLQKINDIAFDALLLRANLFGKLELYDIAVEDYKSCKNALSNKASPEKNIKVILSEIHMADILIKLGNQDEAQDLFDKNINHILQRSGQGGDIMQDLFLRSANFYDQKNDYYKALECYKNLYYALDSKYRGGIGQKTLNHEHAISLIVICRVLVSLYDSRSGVFYNESSCKESKGKYLNIAKEVASLSGKMKSLHDISLLQNTLLESGTRLSYEQLLEKAQKFDLINSDNKSDCLTHPSKVSWKSRVASRLSDCCALM